MKIASLSALALALSLEMITPAQADEWSGGYLTFGLSSARTHLHSSVEDLGPFGTEVDDLGPFIALGYDWDFGGLTLGALVDVELTQGSSDIMSVGKSVLGESDWFATLRGRVGLPVTEQLHVFASAGPALMQARSQIVAAVGESQSARIGGTAFGLGFEYQLSPGRHLTVEYLKADFDRTGFHFDDVAMEPDSGSLRIGYSLRF